MTGHTDFNNEEYRRWIRGLRPDLYSTKSALDIIRSNIQYMTRNPEIVVTNANQLPEVC